MPTDAVILMGLALATCGFLVTRGALELVTLIIVPAAVGAVLALKIYFPPELLMLTAGGVLVGGLMSFKDSSTFTLCLIGLGLAGAVLAMKIFLPAVVITRLALTVIFLGLMKWLVF